MSKLLISNVTCTGEADVRDARLGPRFHRLDLMSQLALLSVERLTDYFGAMPRERIGICLVSRAGSLSTDVEYWKARDLVGGPSPTLFAYTLPSAAIGEIAIRHRLRGPNLCTVGEESSLLPEVEDMLRRGEADGCVCVCCNVVTSEAAKLMQTQPVAAAKAFFAQLDRDRNADCGNIPA